MSGEVIDSQRFVSFCHCNSLDCDKESWKSPENVMKTPSPLLLFLLHTFCLGSTFHVLKKKAWLSESTYVLCIEVTYKNTFPYTGQPKLLPCNGLYLFVCLKSNFKAIRSFLWMLTMITYFFLFLQKCQTQIFKDRKIKAFLWCP